MNVLNYWTDDAIAVVAARLGTPTAQGRDHVRHVLYEANAVPARRVAPDASMLNPNLVMDEKDDR